MYLHRQSAERLEHSGRVLGREAGEDDVQRLSIVEATLDERSNLSRGGGIVASIDPNVAFPYERAGARC